MIGYCQDGDRDAALASSTSAGVQHLFVVGED